MYGVIGYSLNLNDRYAGIRGKERRCDDQFITGRQIDTKSQTGIEYRGQTKGAICFNAGKITKACTEIEQKLTRKAELRNIAE